MSSLSQEPDQPSPSLSEVEGVVSTTTKPPSVTPVVSISSRVSGVGLTPYDPPFPPYPLLEEYWYDYVPKGTNPTHRNVMTFLRNCTDHHEVIGPLSHPNRVIIAKALAKRLNRKEAQSAGYWAKRSVSES